jgi:hypothetical protein
MPLHIRTPGRYGTPGYRRLLNLVREEPHHNPWVTAAGWEFSLAEALHVCTEIVLPGYEAEATQLPAFADLEMDTCDVWCLLHRGEVTTTDVADAHRVLRRYATMAALAGHHF